MEFTFSSDVGQTWGETGVYEKNTQNGEGFKRPQSLHTDVLVNGWLDFVDVLDHLLDDQLLVGGHAVVDRHHLRAHVGVDFGRDVIPGSEMLWGRNENVRTVFETVRKNPCKCSDNY